jgi:hypothetical protein
MTIDLEELLPCPFCGADAERIDIEEGENAGGSCIACTRCMASSNVEFEFKENFVSNWNSRVDSDRIRALEAENARLREALKAVADLKGWDKKKPISATGIQVMQALALAEGAKRPLTPPGYQLVPTEPSEADIERVARAICLSDPQQLRCTWPDCWNGKEGTHFCSSDRSARAAYRAALAEAKKP